MTSTSITTYTLRLRRGQAMQAAFDAGTVLQVTGGTVLLREPMRWLADTMVAPAVRLDRGRCHAPAAGACVLEAVDGDVELLQHVPALRGRGLWRRWWRAAAVA